MEIGMNFAVDPATLPLSRGPIGADATGASVRQGHFSLLSDFWSDDGDDS